MGGTPSYEQLWLENRAIILDRRLKGFFDELRDDLSARWATSDAQARQGAVVLCVAFLAALIDLWKARALRGGR